MTGLVQNIMQGHWLRWWLTLSFAVMFSGVFLFNSQMALLNVVDVLFFLPALTLVTRALASGDHKVLASPSLLPLYGLLAWALLSMVWADQPNHSRTVRAVVQVVILVGLCRWLHLYFRHTLKKALANGALAAMMVAAAVMVSYYTTQPLNSPLFSQPANLFLDVPSLDMPSALMALVAPTFILLAQAREEGVGSKGARRLVGALVGLVFLCLVNLTTGLMAVMVGLAWLVLRSRYPWMALLPLAAAFYLMLQSTGQIVVSNYLLHPWVGNGLNQETLNGVMAQQGNQLLTFAHPHNLYLLVIHALGLVGLGLFLACWLVPLAILARRRPDWRQDNTFLISVLPGLMVLFAGGAYLLLPFHASWMSLWIPLALLLARLSERPSAQPTRN